MDTFTYLAQSAFPLVWILVPALVLAVRSRRLAPVAA